MGKRQTVPEVYVDGSLCTAEQEFWLIKTVQDAYIIQINIAVSTPLRRLKEPSFLSPIE